MTGSTVLSHQVFNELNYIYLEALYLDLPIIHNSEILKDYGYYYDDCNISAAVNCLEIALNNHQLYIERNKSSILKLLSSLNPLNESNIKAYSLLIMND